VDRAGELVLQHGINPALAFYPRDPVEAADTILTWK